MFTGIVEEIGVVSVHATDASTGSADLTISLGPESTLLSDCKDGDSIAVNGVCLTVTSFKKPSSFVVGVAPETLRITDLGQLVEGSRVNLEPAVRADTHMGGHFVQGHVDTTAEILSVEKDGNALTYRFQPKNRSMMQFIVFKGFIALDGTSLTVTQVNDLEGWFEIMLIVYTQSRVVIAEKKKGDTINIEVDMMAKYAQKSLAGILGGDAGATGIPLLEKMVERIVAQALGAKQ
ncbi:hypothetical protein G7046_g1372 [Stylonectria norvegica]|nr:hypothetical protein G7046_g1372 [Stylonectria norvegica]